MHMDGEWCCFRMAWWWHTLLRLLLMVDACMKTEVMFTRRVWYMQSVHRRVRGWV